MNPHVLNYKSYMYMYLQISQTTIQNHYDLLPTYLSSFDLYMYVQWNLSITDTIGESQFVRYREVSLVERFSIFQHLMTIIVIYIHVVIIISSNVACVAELVFHTVRTPQYPSENLFWWLSRGEGESRGAKEPPFC